MMCKDRTWKPKTWGSVASTRASKKGDDESEKGIVVRKILHTTRRESSIGTAKTRWETLFLRLDRSPRSESF